jgi:hypothetical protein
MKTSDPLKRRFSFIASSVAKSEDALVISGTEAGERVTLTSTDGRITADTPLARRPLIVAKIQLLGRPPWLTLDFRQGSEISRIVANVEALDCSSIESDISLLAKGGCVLFYSRIRNEN